MCCFSRPVESVADTNIFARASRRGRQYLVYAMQLNAPEDLAMILPLPVPSGSAEDAVRFINLEEYPEFFTEMLAGFPMPLSLDSSRDDSKSAEPPEASLEVVEVGNFEASFVPSLRDFSRLEKRFRLSRSVWDKLPQYAEFGFAVFQLKAGEQKVHPMAFEFPRANPRELFFPTVHIHDGKIHEQADFDHALYCQLSGNEDLSQEGWEESMRPASMFMQIDKCEGLLNPDQHCYRREMRGEFENKDIMI